MRLDERVLIYDLSEELSDEDYVNYMHKDRSWKIVKLWNAGKLGKRNLSFTLKKYSIPGSLPSEEKALKELLLPKLEQLEKAVQAYLKRVEAKRKARMYASKEERMLMESAKDTDEYPKEDKPFVGNAVKRTQFDEAVNGREPKDEED